MVAVVGALGLAGCTGTPAPAPSGSTGAAAGNAAGATVVALDDLYRSIAGGVQQRLATDRVTYQVTRDATAQCMAAAKVTYYPAPFSTGYEGESDADVAYPGGTDGWLAHLSSTELGVGKRLLLQAAEVPQPAPEVAAMPAADRATYAAQLAKCQPPAGSAAGQASPASAPQLLTALDTMIAGLLAQPQVQQLTSGYPACMARAGYADAGTPKVLADRIATGYPPDAAAAQPAGAEWTAAAKAEAKAAAADRACRQPAYVAALTALAPELTKFSQVQAGPLTQVATEWKAIVAAASADAASN